MTKPWMTPTGPAPRQIRPEPIEEVPEQRYASGQRRTAPIKVREWCACGQWIECEPDEESIEHAVQVHQRQPEHRDYVALEQLAGRFVARQPLQLMHRRLA